MRDDAVLFEQSSQEVQAGVKIIEDSANRLAVPERLFALDQMDVFYDSDERSVWTFMNPSHRPSFTEPMLDDIEMVQTLVGTHFGPGKVPVDFLVLGSRVESVFSLGGDLDLFSRLIRESNRDGLIQYGKRCVEISYRNINALNLPMLTIGLAQGTALGGGFEALLSFDFIIAEEGVEFGLPEAKFGLFPGMGAHAILTRKLGSAMADRMILSSDTWTARQLFDLGIVHQVVEKGQGIEAVQRFIQKSRKHHAGILGSRRASQVASPISINELYRIVEIWAESALLICDQDLRLMQRLVTAQDKLPNSHEKLAKAV